MKVRIDGVLEEQPVTGPVTDAELRAAPVDTTDIYTDGEALASQTGAAGVLTFTFSAPVDMAWVTSISPDENNPVISWADPFGGTPADGTGIPCIDRSQQPLTVVTSGVKVWADTGVVVAVWGYRY